MSKVKIFENESIAVHQQEGEDKETAILIENKTDVKIALFIHSMGPGFMIAGANVEFAHMEGESGEKKIRFMVAMPQK